MWTGTIDASLTNRRQEKKDRNSGTENTLQAVETSVHSSLSYFPGQGHLKWPQRVKPGMDWFVFREPWDSNQIIIIRICCLPLRADRPSQLHGSLHRSKKMLNLKYHRKKVSGNQGHHQKIKHKKNRYRGKGRVPDKRPTKMYFQHNRRRNLS